MREQKKKAKCLPGHKWMYFEDVKNVFHYDLHLTKKRALLGKRRKLKNIWF